MSVTDNFLKSLIQIDDPSVTEYHLEKVLNIYETLYIKFCIITMLGKNPKTGLEIGIKRYRDLLGRIN